MLRGRMTSWFIAGRIADLMCSLGPLRGIPRELQLSPHLPVSSACDDDVVNRFMTQNKCWLIGIPPLAEGTIQTVHYAHTHSVRIGLGFVKGVWSITGS